MELTDWTEEIISYIKFLHIGTDLTDIFAITSVLTISMSGMSSMIISLRYHYEYEGPPAENVTDDKWSEYEGPPAENVTDDKWSDECTAISK